MLIGPYLCTRHNWSGLTSHFIIPCITLIFVVPCISTPTARVENFEVFCGQSDWRETLQKKQIFDISKRFAAHFNFNTGTPMPVDIVQGYIPRNQTRRCNNYGFINYYASLSMLARVHVSYY